MISWMDIDGQRRKNGAACKDATQRRLLLVAWNTSGGQARSWEGRRAAPQWPACGERGAQMGAG